MIERDAISEVISVSKMALVSPPFSEAGGNMRFLFLLISVNVYQRTQFSKEGFFFPLLESLIKATAIVLVHPSPKKFLDSTPLRNRLPPNFDVFLENSKFF